VAILATIAGVAMKRGRENEEKRKREMGEERGWVREIGRKMGRGAVKRKWGRK
jgi:hypothetical protein